MKKSISLPRFLLSATSASGSSSKKSNSKTIGSSSKGKDSNSNKETTFVVASTQIEGKIQSDRNMRIDGHVKGEITCTAKVVIGENGVVEGIIQADSCIVEGKVNGDIIVKEELYLGANSNLSGTFKAAKLNVDLGAVLNGTVEIHS